jgi:hypothetical protein
MPVKTLKTSLILFLGLFIFSQNNTAASFIYPKSVNTNTVNGMDYLKASVFVKLSAKEFSSLTGTKLNFLQKLYFKSVQRKLSREVKKNPELLITEYYSPANHKFKFDALWFVVGAIIGPLGILFAFTSKQPKSNRISAAMGCILFVLWFGYIFIF